MIERDILRLTAEQKTSMNIITLSTLIRMKLLLALIKSYILKRPLWHRDAGIQDEMKVCHFSAMIALLNLAIMTTSRRVFATDVSKIKKINKKREQNGNKNNDTACHSQSDSSPSFAQLTWINQQNESQYMFRPIAVICTLSRTNYK